MCLCENSVPSIPMVMLMFPLKMANYLWASRVFKQTLKVLYTVKNVQEPVRYCCARTRLNSHRINFQQSNHGHLHFLGGQLQIKTWLFLRRSPKQTVDGRNPAAVDRCFILFIPFQRLQPSKVVQDFFHPQYVLKSQWL